MAWQPDYVTTNDMKSYLGGIDDAVDDAEIAFAITAASRSIDQYTNRQFGLLTASEGRVYTAWRDGLLRKYVVEIDDLMSPAVTGAVITGADTITDFSLRPANADLNGRPYTRIVINSGGRGDLDGITVTAKFGWTTVPTAIQQATLLQAARFFKRKDAPFGIAGSPELGSEVRLLAKVDPDVAVALGPYRRRRLVA